MWGPCLLIDQTKPIVIKIHHHKLCGAINSNLNEIYSLKLTSAISKVFSTKCAVAVARFGVRDPFVLNPPPSAALLALV